MPIDSENKLPPDASRIELIAKVNAIEESLSELLEIFKAIKGGVRFFVLTSKLLQWLATTGAAIAAIAGAVFTAVTYAKTGKFPYDH